MKFTLCLSIFIYIYIYIYAHTYIYIIYIYIYIYIHIYTYITSKTGVETQSYSCVLTEALYQKSVLSSMLYDEPQNATSGQPKERTIQVNPPSSPAAPTVPNRTLRTRQGLTPPRINPNSVVRQNQTHAATHTICGLCVPRRPVVPLSLRLKPESELQVFSCVLTLRYLSETNLPIAVH